MDDTASADYKVVRHAPGRCTGAQGARWVLAEMAADPS